MNTGTNAGTKTYPTILHVISGLNVGGAEMMLLKLLRSSPEIRHAVLSLSEGGELLPEIEALGIPVHQVPMPGGLPRPGLCRTYRQLVQSTDPDVVAAWMYRANALASMLTPPEVPVVWHVRQSLDHNSSQRLLFRFTRRVNRFIARHTARGPALVVYNSRSSRDQHRRFGLDASPDRVIPNGFDTDQFRPDREIRAAVRREWGFGEEETVFGIVGRHHPIKNHIGFVRAAGRAQVALLPAGSSLRFVMAGRGLDRDNAPLNREIEACGLSGSVVLLGERRDLPCVYNGFDFLVSSSLVEAFPNVLGEAMSCGVPCIATAVGDSAWIVGDTGVSVPPDDPAVLGEAMAAAASWPVVERKRRGSAARARVVENFAIAAVTEEFLRAYEDVRRGRRDERCT